jgi:hypothetical protein
MTEVHDLVIPLARAETTCKKVKPLVESALAKLANITASKKLLKTEKQR